LADKAGAFCFRQTRRVLALCHRDCAGSRWARAKRGVDVIADVFAGKPFDHGIDDACDQTAHSAHSAPPITRGAGPIWSPVKLR
jgi:hypothetical protein